MDLPRTNPAETFPKESGDSSRQEKNTRKARRSAASLQNGGGARYFLSSANADGEMQALVLGEEIATEDEVLVAAFKKDLPFYRVETWRARAEKKGRNMVLRKQS